MVIQAGLYNNKASDLDRRSMLEDILKKQSNNYNEEDEIPDDEDINKIISRDDSEFQIYQKMDQIRKEMEISLYKLKNLQGNYRLMKINEIPLWAKQEEKIQEEQKTRK